MYIGDELQPADWQRGGETELLKGSRTLLPTLTLLSSIAGVPLCHFKNVNNVFMEKVVFWFICGVFFFYYNKKKYSKFSCLNMCVHAAAQQMQLARSHFLYYDPSWKVQDEKLSSLCQILLLEVAVAAALCQNWSQAMFCKHRVVLSRPHSRRLTQFEWGEWRLDNRCSVSMGFVQPLIIEVQEWNV